MAFAGSNDLAVLVATVTAFATALTELPA